MDIPDELLCLYHARLEATDETATVRVPQEEIDNGAVEPGDTVRVAVLPPVDSDEPVTEPPRPPSSNTLGPQPPVQEGEQRDLEIESLGDQGDGVARTEEGFVVIVPDTTPGERVRVELTDVTESVAFAEVLKHYDA